MDKKVCLVAMAVLVSAAALAQQSNNHVLHAVPPPARVVVDGDLTDWDLSGRIEVFAHYKMRNSYSTKVAAMYDADYFYLSVVWRDPTPMFNMIDSRFDAGSGWRADCVQLRVKTDMVMHIDCWYSTAARRPVINIAYGRFTHGQGPEDVTTFEPLIDAVKAGAKEGFRMGADRKSYTQEIALPWRLITAAGAVVKETGRPYKEPRLYKAGDTLTLGMEFLWGGPDGKTWPVHRYADLLKEGHTGREFFWTAENAWGTVKLEPRGNLDLPRPEITGVDAFLQKTEGPVALRYTMPFDGFVTIVVEDENGIRVRNVVGMAPRSKGETVDYWDGTDENGKLAPPGKYRWRGLIHQGIDPVYEASYGTPGDPPWDNAANTGAWMSDHNAPLAVAAGADMMVLGAGGSEAGWALIGTDLDGRKKWGLRKFQNVASVAVDDRYVYAGIAGTWGSYVPAIGRAELTTGRYAPFETKPEPTLIAEVLGEGEEGHLTGIAVLGGRIAVSLAGVNVVRYFDSRTAGPLGQVAVDDPGGLTFDAAGNLYVLSGTRVLKIANGEPAEFVSANLESPRDVAVDGEGRLFVSDRGTNQIKVFDKAGSFIRAIGIEGGRPKPGRWVPGGMKNPAGLDVDAQGRIWVAEEDIQPKRVSVWSADGELITDFIGPTTYGGMGGFADAQDKTRVFGVGCEWKLDYENNEAKVVANRLDRLYAGDLVKLGGREYFMAKRGRLFVRRGAAFAPVARFGHIRSKQDLATAGLPADAQCDTFPANFLWSDRNGDGEMQAQEIVFRQGMTWDCGYWGGYWLDDNFNLYTVPGGYGRDEVQRIARTGWTEGGAPIWDVDGIRTYLDRAEPAGGGGGPGKVFLVDGDTVIFGSKPITAVKPDGTIAWTYQDNWPDVHGSHHAPIPQSDAVLVGVLTCIGKADTGTALGKVWAMNSNMGRLYIMTTDGLLVASVFQDCRAGADPWPAEAKAGAPMGGVSMGGEWFGGYFFKSEPTSEYYLIAGGTSYNMIRLDGFDSLRPLEGGAFTFTGENLIAAERLQQQRAAEGAAANQLAVAHLPQAPTVDARLEEYAKDDFVEWTAAGYRARAAVAAAGGDLCLAYEVWGDGNPMVNAGQDYTHLFVTGDSVDLQLGTNPDADPKRTGPVVGDLRLLMSVLNGEPVAVLYRWKTDAAKKPQTFRCPWRQITLDSVELLTDAAIRIVRRGGGYIVEATVPLKTLGFNPQPGKQYKIDLGVIYSDAKGNDRAARVYWSNKATGLTADVPGEIMASPNLWGTATVAK